MDAQDHKKTSPSEHEGRGVHVCHKCGWPFPNPHPSSKHRRAHKKVCGKIEGYQMNDSGSGRRPSDDDHLSDDEMRTPSPNMEKGVIKELGNSEETGLLRSNKSEDEVFADAVTDFSDSGLSPSLEEPLDKVGQLDKSVGKELAYDLDDSQPTKGVGTDGTGNSMGKEEAVGNVTTQLENTKPSSNIIVEEVSVGVHQIDGQLVKTSEVALENNLQNIDTDGNSKKDAEVKESREVEEGLVKTSEIEEPKIESVIDDLKERGLEHVVLDALSEENADVKESSEVEEGPVNMSEIEEPKIESVTDDLKERGLEPVVLDTAVPEEGRKALDGAILEPKLLEADMKVVSSAAGGEIAEQEQELSNSAETGNVIITPILHKDQTMLPAETTERDLSSQIMSPTSIDGSITAPIEAVSVKDTLESGNNKLGEDEFKGEGNGETLSVRISEDLSVIENPEILLEDFKDYRVLKSSFPLDLENTVENRPAESDEKLVSEPDVSTIPGITHSDVNSLDNFEKGGGDLEAAGEEAVTSGLQVITEEGSGSNVFERQNIKNSEESHFRDEKLSQIEISAPYTVEVAGVTSPRSSAQASKVENGDDSLANESHQVTAETRTSSSVEQGMQGLENVSDSEPSPSDTLGVVSVICSENPTVETDKESEKLIDTKVQRATCTGDGTSELNPEGQSEVSEKNLGDSVLNEPVPSPAASVISKPSSVAGEDIHIEDATSYAPLVADADHKLTVDNINASAVDDPVISCSRTESLEGNWGSVSVLSTQSDGTTRTDVEALSTAVQAPDKSEGASPNHQTTNDAQRSDKSDVFEPPSFMSLVDSQSKLDHTVAASEIKTVQKTEPSKSEAAQAGWIPSLTNVTNESEGRKKNEELIAKVTNWSSGKQHSPLKNLLNEAQAETNSKTAPEKQLSLTSPADETASKNNGAAVTTVSSIMGSETPVHDAAKREMEKEWNSPARYPTEIKKEKKKSKPYWVPFVCCSSVHRDM